MTKIALCQMEVVAKRPDKNYEKACSMLEEAARNGATMAVFPEMAIPGYLVGDIWEDQTFLNDCVWYSSLLVEFAATRKMTVIFGTVTDGTHLGFEPEFRGEDGRIRKYNSAVTASGSSLSIYNKTNLPNYREFDDKRYFASGNGCPHPVHSADLWTTTSICEDGWDDDYEEKPIATAYKQLECSTATHIHFNLSCSPYTKGKNGARNRRFAKHSQGFAALCYVNCVGSQNNGKDVFVFDGSTTVYLNGGTFGALPPLVECIGYLEQDGSDVTITGTNWLTSQLDPSLDEVLVYGTKKFLEQCGVGKVVIGLSGGIDSALSAMIHVQALGKENVVLVNMPTEFNSATTKGIAATIAQKLGCPYMVVPIGDICRGLESSITTPFKDIFLDKGGMGFTKVDTSNLLTPVMESYRVDSENIAARMRGAGVQAALAAGLKAVFPNNGNKSELSVGYCTMYGDLGGYLAPLADLWKTEVYVVARQMSADMGDVLPESIFTLKPSAELCAEQNVDEGKGDPQIYWYHDKLFASWMEPWSREGIEGTLHAYKAGTLLSKFGLEDRKADFLALFPTADKFIADTERWWNLFTGLSVVKRVQAPPVLAVSRRAYGYDFRESIGSQGLTNRYKQVKKEILEGDK